MITALALLTNRYTLIALGSIVLLANGYFAWQHYVAEPYRAQGRAEMRPAIEVMGKQLANDVAAFKQIERYMSEIKASSEKLKKQVIAANATNATRRTTETTRVEYIDRIVPGGNTECERTSDAVLKGLRR